MVRSKCEHGFCKVETDDVALTEDHAIRLLNPRVRSARWPEALRPAVAEFSSEEGAPVENRASAVEEVGIMGAAGRDFHNFNVVFRNNPRYRVVAFTAAQISNIAGRSYPGELAGELYPDGIPIRPDAESDSIIATQAV